MATVVLLSTVVLYTVHLSTVVPFTVRQQPTTLQKIAALLPSNAHVIQIAAHVVTAVPILARKDAIMTLDLTTHNLFLLLLLLLFTVKKCPVLSS